MRFPKRIFQFRLSTFLVLMCVSGTFLGWELYKYRKHQEAIVFLEENYDVEIIYGDGWFYSPAKAIDIDGEIATLEPISDLRYLEEVGVGPLHLPPKIENEIPIYELKYPTFDSLGPLYRLNRIKKISVFSSSPIQFDERAFPKSLETLIVGCPFPIDPTPLKYSHEMDLVILNNTPRPGWKFQTMEEYQAHLQQLRHQESKFDALHKQFPNCEFSYPGPHR